MKRKPNVQKRKKSLKDASVKQLTEYEDVFADIVNSLLYEGRQIVNPEDLESAPQESALYADGRLNRQIRDVKKYLKQVAVRIAAIGLENESGQGDANLPIRVIGYDAAEYRMQYSRRKSIIRKNGQHKKKPVPVPPFYPVCTIVLSFHDEKSRIKERLKECFAIPEELDPYISDYQINLFELAYFSEEQLKRFQSDFRYIAGFQVQARNAKEGKPADYRVPLEKIVHLDEFLDLLAVLSGCSDIREILEESNNTEEEGEMRTTIYDIMKERGREEGEAIGKEIGKIIGAVETMRDEGKDDQAIMARLISKYGLSKEEAENYVFSMV